MGRTLRKNIKKYQAAPFLTYLIRKWKKTVEDSKTPPPSTISEIKSWADWDEDDGGLPELPEWMSMDENPWKKTTPSIQKTTAIRFVKEYTYKNS